MMKSLSVTKKNCSLSADLISPDKQNHTINNIEGTPRSQSIVEEIKQDSNVFLVEESYDLD